MKKGLKVIAGIAFAFVMAVSVMFSVDTYSVVQPIYASANDLQGRLPLNGEVNGNGVYGYTSNYVLYGGAQEVQHKVQDGWHITAYNATYSNGVMWCECWDTDDGDYYGWIDVNYITFYNGSASPSPSVEPGHITPRKAEVDGNGVYGYTSNYVLYGGSQETQHKVQDGWHITAYNTAYSHGVTWYECWDTDDGDYYGWIDAEYIDFYDERPKPAATSVVVHTVIVTETVKVTQRVTTVTETVIVTENPTESPATVTSETTSTAEAFEAMAVDDNNSGGHKPDMNTVILLVAVGVVVLIAIAAILIVLLTRKTRYIVDPVQHVNGQADDVGIKPVFCMNCGAERKNMNALFCPECGRPYDEQ